MTQYKFAGIEIPNVYGLAAAVPARIGKGGLIMRHGGYIGRRFLDARSINLQCMWLPSVGESFPDMELSYSTFISQLFTAGKSRLFLRPNWFYNAILESANDNKREIGSIEYDMQFYLGDPRQYKLGTSIDGSNDTETSLTIGWNTQFNTSVGIWTPYILELNASSGFSTILTMTPKYGTSLIAGDPLIWKPGSIGITYVYLEEQKANRNGIDVTSEFDGNFFSITPNDVMRITPSIFANNIIPTLRYREARL